MTSHMHDFESLGSNCEFGFILERSGVSAGGLFKWSLILDFAELIAAFDGDFEGMYQSGNLTPSDGTMVQDARFGLRWHTAIKIGVEDGELIFLQPEEERLPIIEQEHAKLYYLVGKFLAELKSRHKIYVVRSNVELSVELLRSILSRLRAIGDATLFVVKQSSEHNSAGTVRLQEDGLYEGYVRYLSTSPGLEDMDDAGWFETCRNAWIMIQSDRGHDISTDDEGNLVAAPRIG